VHQLGDRTGELVAGPRLEAEAEALEGRADLAARRGVQLARGQDRLRGAASSHPLRVAVQVAAVNMRTDADAIAKRFSSKGYTAYVEVPPNGTGTVFRVRIGTFKTKHEAETIAAKLQKEEQIKPWVTR
jgi:septal ring-binding cell division protein DamX